MPEIFTCTDEQLAVYTTRVRVVVKFLILLSSLLILAGFLGLIFTTMYPVKPDTDIEVMPGPEARDIFVPMESKKTLWVTQFKCNINGNKNLCREHDSGLIYCCQDNVGAGMTCTRENGGSWDTWNCFPCECGQCIGTCTSNATYHGQPVPISCRPPRCSAGCPCGTDLGPGNILFSCFEDTPTTCAKLTELQISLNGQYKFFSVLTYIGYIFFTLLIILGELQLDTFFKHAQFFTYWPTRAGLQLFVGMQMVSSSSSLAMTGLYNEGVHGVALFGGWLMTGMGLLSLVINGLFVRKWRPLKYCGLFLIVAIMIIIPIFAAVGTTVSSPSPAPASND